ncbi:MAG: hypothetical protein QXL47_02885 [Candidatus Anstonellales archaeon]
MSKFSKIIKRVGERALFMSTPLILSCAFLHRAPKVDGIETDSKQTELTEVGGNEVEREMVYWKTIFTDVDSSQLFSFLYIAMNTALFRDGKVWDSLTRDEQKERIERVVETEKLIQKELPYWRTVLHDEWVKDTARFDGVVRGLISYSEYIQRPWMALSREKQKEMILYDLGVGTRGKDPEPASLISPPASPFK